MLEIKYVDSGTVLNRPLSWCIVKCNGIKYKAYAKCLPEDEWSEFFGCYCAEVKASIKALTYELKKRKNYLTAMENLSKTLLGCSHLQREESAYTKSVIKAFLMRQIGFQKRDIQQIKDRISRLKKQLENRIKTRSNT